MNLKRITLIALLLILLAACGGQAALETAELDLPSTVDVSTVLEVKERDDVLLLDVREQWEYDDGHIPGVTHLPMGAVPDRMSEIPTDQTVIVTCRTGNRSGQVVNFLRQNGFDNVHNMDGGIVAWQAAGHEVVR